MGETQKRRYVVVLRRTLASVVLIVALASPAAGQVNGEARHSGTITEVVDGRIVLDEIVTWQGPESPGIVRRSIRITPDTAIDLVQRGPWDARTSRPGWSSEPIRPDDLRKGDFVTVTTRGDETGAAVAVEVIRPRG
jgi:hypothetical protein